MEPRPSVVILAGPNGAGKSTVAAFLLPPLSVTEFVNADVIAAAQAPGDPHSAALSAGREMLTRLRHLAVRRISFAFETTLASRHFAPWLADLIAGGYTLHILFVWLPSADIAVRRVRRRVLAGGHDVPEGIQLLRHLSVAGNNVAYIRQFSRESSAAHRRWPGPNDDGGRRR